MKFITIIIYNMIQASQIHDGHIAPPKIPTGQPTNLTATAKALTALTARMASATTRTKALLELKRDPTKKNPRVRMEGITFENVLSHDGYYAVEAPSTEAAEIKAGERMVLATRSSFPDPEKMLLVEALIGRTHTCYKATLERGEPVAIKMLNHKIHRRSNTPRNARLRRKNRPMDSFYYCIENLTGFRRYIFFIQRQHSSLKNNSFQHFSRQRRELYNNRIFLRNTRREKTLK